MVGVERRGYQSEGVHRFRSDMGTGQSVKVICVVQRYVWLGRVEETDSIHSVVGSTHGKSHREIDVCGNTAHFEGVAQLQRNSNLRPLNCRRIDERAEPVVRRGALRKQPDGCSQLSSSI